MSHLHGITTRLQSQLLEMDAPADLELLMARLERRLRQDAWRSQKMQERQVESPERLSA